MNTSNTIMKLNIPEEIRNKYNSALYLMEPEQFNLVCKTVQFKTLNKAVLGELPKSALLFGKERKIKLATVQQWLYEQQGFDISVSAIYLDTTQLLMGQLMKQKASRIESRELITDIQEIKERLEKENGSETKMLFFVDRIHKFSIGDVRSFVDDIDMYNELFRNSTFSTVATTTEEHFRKAVEPNIRHGVLNEILTTHF